jgi:hypothetical protein
MDTWWKLSVWGNDGVQCVGVKTEIKTNSSAGNVGFIVDNVALECGFSPSTSVSPATSYCTNCTTFINHPIMNVTMYRLDTDTDNS